MKDKIYFFQMLTSVDKEKKLKTKKGLTGPFFFCHFMIRIKYNFIRNIICDLLLVIIAKINQIFIERRII